MHNFADHRYFNIQLTYLVYLYTYYLCIYGGYREFNAAIYFMIIYLLKYKQHTVSLKHVIILY